MASFQHTFEFVSKFQTFSLVMTLTPVIRFSSSGFFGHVTMSRLVPGNLTKDINSHFHLYDNFLEMSIKSFQITPICVKFRQNNDISVHIL